MSCAETVEPIEIPFGMWTWVGPTNDVLDGVHSVSVGKISFPLSFM